MKEICILSAENAIMYNCCLLIIPIITRLLGGTIGIHFPVSDGQCLGMALAVIPGHATE